MLLRLFSFGPVMSFTVAVVLRIAGPGRDVLVVEFRGVGQAHDANRPRGYSGACAGGKAASQASPW